MPASELSIRFPPTNSPLSCQHSSPLEQYQSRCGLIIYHPITAYQGRPDPTTNRNIYSTAPKTTVSTVHWRCLEFTSLLRSPQNKNNPQRHCHPSIDRSTPSTTTTFVASTKTNSIASRWHLLDKKKHPHTYHGTDIASPQHSFHLSCCHNSPDPFQQQPQTQPQPQTQQQQLSTTKYVCFFFFFFFQRPNYDYRQCLCACHVHSSHHIARTRSTWSIPTRYRTQQHWCRASGTSCLPVRHENSP